ncbi:hypothetical protein AQJ64_27080 [Streptomyces griseoruber]|uniref:Uncharacterized protein n=2 Tax=Streptomyces griseoruber TaxID=1943 RepID=A0A101STW1_9ACTN|nr:hypothetical protein AQJ64_27080 [Streptomyces griseoruber]
MYLTLVVALCAVVALAGVVVTVVHEPPTWAVVVGTVVGFALGTVLLRMPALADVAQSSIGSWSLRLGAFSAVEALLSLAVTTRSRTAESRPLSSAAAGNVRPVATPGTHSRRTGRKPKYVQYEDFRPARREHAPDAAP